jgi:hypothetical protein
MLSVTGAMLSGGRICRRFEGTAASILRVDEYTAPQNRVRKVRSKSEPFSHTAYASILKMEATDSSETVVVVFNSTRLHFAEDVSIRNQVRCVAVRRAVSTDSCALLTCTRTKCPI